MHVRRQRLQTATRERMQRMQEMLNLAEEVGVVHHAFDPRAIASGYVTELVEFGHNIIQRIGFLQIRKHWADLKVKRSPTDIVQEVHVLTRDATLLRCFELFDMETRVKRRATQLRLQDRSTMVKVLVAEVSDGIDVAQQLLRMPLHGSFQLKTPGNSAKRDVLSFLECTLEGISASCQGLRNAWRWDLVVDLVSFLVAQAWTIPLCNETVSLIEADTQTEFLLSGGEAPALLVRLLALYNAEPSCGSKLSAALHSLRDVLDDRLPVVTGALYLLLCSDSPGPWHLPMSAASGFAEALVTAVVRSGRLLPCASVRQFEDLTRTERLSRACRDALCSVLRFAPSQHRAATGTNLDDPGYTHLKMDIDLGMLHLPIWNDPSLATSLGVAPEEYPLF